MRLVLVFLLATWVAFAFSEQPSPSYHKPKQAKIDQTHPDKPLMKVESTTDQPKARTDWWLVVLTGALVVVAMVQAGVFLYQGLQLQETVKAMRANVAALANAERAHLSFEGFKIIDVRSQAQRPYPMSLGETSSPIALHADLKNYGRTPATITAFWIASIIVEMATFSAHKVPLPLLNLSRTSASDSRTSTIALAEWGEVIAGGKKLVMYGHAEYRDIFGESHISGFACLYIPPALDQDEKFAAVCLDSHWYST